jgi:hypothetical protein
MNAPEQGVTNGTGGEPSSQTAIVVRVDRKNQIKNFIPLPPSPY